MKIQTKALIASAVVLVLALSAVSGITYSWFSDVEKAEITVQTAEVDYDVKFSAQANGVAELKQSGNTFTLTGLAAGATVQISAVITNSSTVGTVYKVVLVPTYAQPGSGSTGLTPYDMKNICVQTSKKTTTDLATGKTGNWTVGTDGVLTGAAFNQILIQDWKQVNAPTSKGQSVGTVTAVITTPDTYGGSDPRQPVVAFDPSSMTGYTAAEKAAVSDQTGLKDWDAQTVRSGLSFQLRVIAVQGDYPYQTMKVDGSTATAILPDNKIVGATTMTASYGSGNVKDVVVDFSGVDEYEYTAEGESETEESLSSQQVKLTIDKIERSQIVLDLALYKVTDGQVSEKPIPSPTFDSPVVITMTVPGEITNPKVVYNGDGLDGTVLSSTVNGSGDNVTTTVVFSVTHFSNYTIKHDVGIETEQELRNALLKGGYIKLAKSLTTTDGALECAVGGTVLDLNGKSITTSDECLIEVYADLEIRNGELTLTNTDENAKSGRVINVDHENKKITGVTLRLRDVSVVGPTGNGLNRGISIYGTEDLTLEIQGGDISANHYALNIASYNTGLKCIVGDATLTGYAAVQVWSPGTQIEFTGCTLNGVNKWYDPSGWDDFGTVVVYRDAVGTGITCSDCMVSAEATAPSGKQAAKEYLFDLRGGCTVTLNGCKFKNNTESVDISKVGDYTSVNFRYLEGVEFEVALDKMTIRAKAYTFTEVKSLEELTEALEAGGYIELQEDITDISEAITISKDTILDLNGHSMTFTNLSLGDAVMISGGDLLVYGDDGKNKSAMTTAGERLFAITADEKVLEIFYGTYKAAETVVYYDGASTTEEGKRSVVYLDAGTFGSTGGSTDPGTIKVTNGTLEISGGTYDFDPTSLLSDGYKATSLGDGYYKVEAKSASESDSQDP